MAFWRFRTGLLTSFTKKRFRKDSRVPSSNKATSMSYPRLDSKRKTQLALQAKETVQIQTLESSQIQAQHRYPKK